MISSFLLEVPLRLDRVPFSGSHEAAVWQPGCVLIRKSNWESPSKLIRVWPESNSPRAPALSGCHLETAFTVPRAPLAPCHVDSPTQPLTASCSREESLVLSARKVATLRANEFTPSRHPLLGGEDLWGTRFSKIPSLDRIYLSFSQRLCNHNLRFISRSHCLNLSSYCPLKKHSFQKSPSPASFLFNSSSIS